MKKNPYFFWLVLIVCCFSLTFSGCTYNNKISKTDEVVLNEERRGSPSGVRWQSLSVREKIGQTMIIVAESDYHKHMYGDVRTMLEKYPVGGIFLPSWNFIRYRPKSDIIPSVKDTIEKYQAASKVPLLITEDFENGMGEFYDDYTALPPLMAVGATNNDELAFNYGNIIARQAKTIGVNWLLHPVVDLNINPLNDLIVDRSISDDVSRAYPLISAQLQGMYSAGVVPTIKHFPGDGTSMKNQHLVTSENVMSLSEWNKTYGNLYKKLIQKNKVPSIMVGHIRFPAYQTKKLKNVLPPATLSDEIIVGLLKGKLNFQGVVMSDALNMGGSGGYYHDALETAIETFKSGVDIVLWPGLEYMDEVEKRINSGEIPMSRLDDAVKRIWSVREKYGLLEKNSNPFAVHSKGLKDESNDIAKIIAESAVTLVEDNQREIPISPARYKKIALISISFDKAGSKFKRTYECLLEKGFEVDPVIHNPNWYQWQSKINSFEKYDKVIVLFGNRNSSPMGSSMLKGEEAMGAWTASMIPAEKIIAISYGNPYYLNYYLANAPIKINAYGFNVFSQQAVIDAIVGSIPFKGSSPVKLDSKSLK